MGKRYTSIHDNDPLRVVLASRLSDRMADFKKGLAAHAEVEIFQADSGEEALQFLADQRIDLIAIDQAVTDMSGLEVAQAVAQFHPFVSSVLVSDASEADFHEQTEGLGVLMRLPEAPDESVALKVLQHMEKAFAAKVC